MENNSTADLRALAERVETGEEGRNTDAEIMETLGHQVTWATARWTMESYPVILWRPPHPYAGMREPCPRITTDLNAVAAAWQPLRERGWELSIKQLPAIRWQANGIYNPDRIEFYAKAETLPRAWLALLLRCMAAEMEAAQ